MTTASMCVGVTENGDPPSVWVAKIKYEFTEGCHVFTSDEIPGFLVASNDPHKALRQIQPVIQTLINKNHKAECSVVLGKEFREFEKAHTIHSPVKDNSVSLKDTYAVISSKAA